MKSTLRFLCLLALTGVLTALDAHAQAVRIYVASYGNDSNDGTRLSPKRTFQSAHDAVAAGGNIIGLDTAGYASGNFNITKNLSINMSPGCEGIVTCSVSIDTGLRVTLRGLRIESPAPGANSGIYANSVSSLQVENCTITGFGAAGGNTNTTGGIYIGTTGVVGSVVVTDTVISDCPGSAITHGTSGSPTNSSLVLERCRLLSNTQGLYAASSGRVTVRNCTVANHTSIGIRGGGMGASDVKVNVENSEVTDNGTGISSWFTGSVTVSNTAITGNGTGVTGSTGSPTSFGNNQLTNNTTDGTFGAVLTQK
jgi:hypothetical protein